MGNKRKDTKQQGAKKRLETPEHALKRLNDEIIHEAKLIATGCTESCYDLVEKTKKLMAIEDGAQPDGFVDVDDEDGDGDDDSSDDQ